MIDCTLLFRPQTHTKKQQQKNINNKENINENSLTLGKDLGH